MELNMSEIRFMKIKPGQSVECFRVNELSPAGDLIMSYCAYHNGVITLHRKNQLGGYRRKRRAGEHWRSS